MDFTARSIHYRSNPSNAGTEHLAWGVGAQHLPLGRPSQRTTDSLRVQQTESPPHRSGATTRCPRSCQSVSLVFARTDLLDDIADEACKPSTPIWHFAQLPHMSTATTPADCSGAPWFTSARKCGPNGHTASACHAGWTPIPVIQCLLPTQVGSAQVRTPLPRIG